MLIETPRYTERFGSVRIHGTQKVLELDSGEEEEPLLEPAVRKVSRLDIEKIEKKMAIIVPIKGEELKLFEGVLSGIPHNCLIVVISNSQREPVNRYRMERDALEHFCKFTTHQALIIHQKDRVIADALRKVGYKSILDEDGLVRNGKAEGMILGILMAKLTGKNYVGFVDADNYMPGAVHEYVKNFAAGFIMPESPYVMVRNAWLFKPKILGSDVYFRKWGRVSEFTNQHVNAIISTHTHFETDVIKTANAGEHAISMDLVNILPFASGFAVEPYELMFIFEQFGGIKPTAHKDVVEKGIDIYQIETRNPHFHKEKGDKHIADMLLVSLASIYHSNICDEETRKAIKSDLARHRVLSSKKEIPKPMIYPAIKSINIDIFREAVKEIMPKIELVYGKNNRA